MCVRYVQRAVAINSEFQGARTCVEKTEGITACGPGRGRQAQPRAPYIGASENILGKVASE